MPYLSENLAKARIVSWSYSTANYYIYQIKMLVYKMMPMMPVMLVVKWKMLVMCAKHQRKLVQRML